MSKTSDILTQLSVKRGEKFDDSRLVTPLECLKQIVADIESGKEPAPDQMVVTSLTFSTKNKDRHITDYHYAGLNFRDALALLEIAKHDLLKQ